MDWTTPEDLDTQLTRLWNKGRLLIPPAEGGAVFPLKLRLRRPDSRTLGGQFDEVRRWIRLLEEGSRAHRGFGYELESTEIEHRQLGRNRVPTGVTVPTRQDALQLIGKQRAAQRFEKLAHETLAARPELRSWLHKRPLTALEHAEVWSKILAVLAWFAEHPSAGLYLRQIDITGVDTKFIEAHRSLLFELFELVLPPASIDQATRRDFEARYGLLAKQPLIRFRILDPSYRLSGLSDIATPAPEFAGLNLPVHRVFITENEINGLAFPELPGSLVIFGLGYGLERLGQAEWLHKKEIFYWGDIDTHGFAILDRLRNTFPQAQSLLMDRETLLHHRASWVTEASPCLVPLTRLSESERTLFEDLRDDRLGKGVRLEQERVGFGWVERALGGLRS